MIEEKKNKNHPYETRFTYFIIAAHSMESFMIMDLVKAFFYR